MKCKVLAERVDYLKNSKEGVGKMCKLMDDLWLNGKEEGKEEGMQRGNPTAKGHRQSRCPNEMNYAIKGCNQGHRRFFTPSVSLTFYLIFSNVCMFLIECVYFLADIA